MTAIEKVEAQHRETPIKCLGTLSGEAIFFIFSIASHLIRSTVKILKIGTPKIITIIVLQLEQLDFTVQ